MSDIGLIVHYVTRRQWELGLVCAPAIVIAKSDGEAWLKVFNFDSEFNIGADHSHQGREESWHWIGECEEVRKVWGV